MFFFSIVLDGLEESAHWKSMLQPSSKLRTSRAVRIIVPSQFDQQISTTLSTAFGPNCLSFDITAHFHSDIHAFVKQKALEVIDSRPSLAGMNDFIVESVLARSGCFSGSAWPCRTPFCMHTKQAM
jgi:hypothetical protein